MPDRANAAFVETPTREARRACARIRPKAIHAVLAGAITLLLLALPPQTFASDGAQSPAGDSVRFFHRAAAGPELAALLNRLRAAEVAVRIFEINRFFNRFRYRSDPELWQRTDHWASPRELLSRGAGDCEDIAIGKYFALRALGVPDAHLAVTYAYDRSAGAPHMVLIYTPPGAGALILDRRPAYLMDGDARNGNLVPVYGFNATSAFLVPLAGLSGAPTRRLLPAPPSRWAALLESMAGDDLFGVAAGAGTGSGLRRAPSGAHAAAAGPERPMP